MTTWEIVGYCMSAFGIGYGGGALRMIAKRAIEHCE